MLSTKEAHLKYKDANGLKVSVCVRAYHGNRKHKKVSVNMLLSAKINLESRALTDKEEYFIMM